MDILAFDRPRMERLVVPFGNNRLIRNYRAKQLLSRFRTDRGHFSTLKKTDKLILCWLHGTSVQETSPLRLIDLAYLPRIMRWAYNRNA